MGNKLGQLLFLNKPVLTYIFLWGSYRSAHFSTGAMWRPETHNSTWTHKKRKTHGSHQGELLIYWIHGADFKVAAFDVVTSALMADIMCSSRNTKLCLCLRRGSLQWARLRRPGCCRWKRLCRFPWRRRLWRRMLLRVTRCRSAQVPAFWMRASCCTAVEALSCAATPASAGRAALLWPAGSGSARLERQENSRCNISRRVINNFSHLITSRAFVSWRWAELDCSTAVGSGPWLAAELASVET